MTFSITSETTKNKSKRLIVNNWFSNVRLANIAIMIPVAKMNAFMRVAFNSINLSRSSSHFKCKFHIHVHNYRPEVKYILLCLLCQIF